MASVVPSSQHYPMEVVSKMNSILSNDKVGPITSWNSVLELLHEHHISYIVEDISPKLMLVHPDNRGKLGVNPFNSHRTGAYIRKVGADLALLTKSTAFELQPIGDKNVCANRVQQAAGRSQQWYASSCKR